MDRWIGRRGMHWLSGTLAACLLVTGSGCATIMKGTSQTVTFYTSPRDADVRYRGRPVTHGQLFRIDKTPEPPVVTVHDDDGHGTIPLTYDPDPLVIVDGLLLILGILPGVIALAVDFSTGAWREVHVNQQIDATQARPARRP